MANSDSDCPWSSAHQSQKPKHCRKKRKAKLITVMDDNIDLKSKHGKKTAAAAAEDPESGGASKISRPCSECGKKFWSWKALFGHMRCHPEREWRGINPPPNFRRQNDNKRSVWTTTEEDHEVAQSLLLLANGSCTHDHQVSETCVPLEAPNSPAGPSGCSRVFVPGQALGGHRASHKIDDGGGGDGDGSGEGGDGDQESKMEMVLLGGHKCSICQKVFSSGQALGGHKRCHWEKGDNSAAIVSSSDPSSSSITITTQPKQACGCGVGVDLNLPPPLPPLQHHSPLTLDLRLGL